MKKFLMKYINKQKEFGSTYEKHFILNKDAESGDRALRVYSDEAAASKIFIEFIAFIVRSKMYVCLKDVVMKMDKNPNYVNAPATLHGLEK